MYVLRFIQPEFLLNTIHWNGGGICMNKLFEKVCFEERYPNEVTPKSMIPVKEKPILYFYELSLLMITFVLWMFVIKRVVKSKVEFPNEHKILGRKGFS
uniref:Uncharacterized protein n=1 Tax=Caenorhabditis tropicalis TaxID=1561998 RepID=A0A1I7TYK6_9PELO